MVRRLWQRLAGWWVGWLGPHDVDPDREWPAAYTVWGDPDAP